MSYRSFSDFPNHSTPSCTMAPTEQVPPTLPGAAIEQGASR
jgi:hypothetical protein